MSTPSAIPQVIDALVASFKAALGDDAVYDGPGVSSASPQKYVLVGVADPDGEFMDEAASSTQEWAWLGHVQRDETLTVHCVAVAWNGDTDMKKARDDAFDVVRLVTDEIQADPTYGNQGVLWVQAVSSISLRQLQDENGAIVYLPFDITIRARPE